MPGAEGTVEKIEVTEFEKSTKAKESLFNSVSPNGQINLWLLKI